LPDQLLVIVTGPTASGKTDLSVHIAAHFKTEIVSADSRQFFKDIPIGTAQPDQETLAAVPHHFIGEFPLDTEITAGSYSEMCRVRLEKLFRKHRVVVLTGGSGLYIDAVLYGVDNFPEADPSVREELNRKYHHEGLEGLQLMLRKLDPQYYSTVDLMNPRRLIRALEVCIAAGKPYSAFLGNNSSPLPWPYLMTGILWDRETLYERINRRVDLMMQSGLLQEAEAVYSRRHLNSLHTVGFTELFAYMDGAFDLEKAVGLIKQHSRNYAKRQLTWFRKHREMQWLEPGQEKKVISLIEAAMKES
jgi:tRNA dimethylallyltransferase